MPGRHARRGGSCHFILECLKSTYDVSANLWRDETLDARPPKDEAIVLNSTCLISRASAGLDGFW